MKNPNLLVLLSGLLVGGLCGSGVVYRQSHVRIGELESEMIALQVEYDGVLEEYVKLSMEKNYLSARALEQEFLFSSYNEIYVKYNLLLRKYDDLSVNYTDLSARYDVLSVAYGEVIDYLVENGLEDFDYLPDIIDE
jgi:hypothetical protein